MSARTAVLLMALAVAMGFAGGCDRAAAATPPPDGWGAAELRIAERYWGTAPSHCATLSIEFDATEMAIGWADGEATQAVWPDTECMMRIVRMHDILWQCRLVVHEYGHLLGLGHAGDVHSIMWRNPYRARVDIAGCDRLARRARR